MRRLLAPFAAHQWPLLGEKDGERGREGNTVREDSYEKEGEEEEGEEEEEEGRGELEEEEEEEEERRRRRRRREQREPTHLCRLMVMNRFGLDGVK